MFALGEWGMVTLGGDDRGRRVAQRDEFSGLVDAALEHFAVDPAGSLPRLHGLGFFVVAQGVERDFAGVCIGEKSSVEGDLGDVGQCFGGGGQSPTALFGLCNHGGEAVGK